MYDEILMVRFNLHSLPVYDNPPALQLPRLALLLSPQTLDATKLVDPPGGVASPVALPPSTFKGTTAEPLALIFGGLGASSSAETLGDGRLSLFTTISTGAGF